MMIDLRCRWRAEDVCWWCIYCLPAMLRYVDDDARMFTTLRLRYLRALLSVMILLMFVLRAMRLITLCDVIEAMPRADVKIWCRYFYFALMMLISCARELVIVWYLLMPMMLFIARCCYALLSRYYCRARYFRHCQRYWCRLRDADTIIDIWARYCRALMSGEVIIFITPSPSAIRHYSFTSFLRYIVTMARLMPIIRYALRLRYFHWRGRHVDYYCSMMRECLRYARRCYIVKRRFTIYAQRG